ncbi:MAG TPA: glycosyltransferase family 9 protein, partial [Dehalococcoidia bacterium]|nr:glycosyltransferase family 9 protein [Dehalococcoidia bacterium]
MESPDWQRIERALVVRLDNIGDVVMLTPALRALREAAPRAHITLLASPAGAQVAPMLPWVDDVIVERAVWQDISGTPGCGQERDQALIRRLAEGEFEVAFIFTSFSQSPYPPAYACYLAGIPVRVGQSKEFGGQVLTHWLRSCPDETHQVERNLALLRHVGIVASDGQMELRLGPDVLEAAAGLLARAGLAA